MKQIEVVAAIIRKGDKYLAVQRGYGEFAGFWEFPGGKIEPHESREEALRREIMEELCFDINIEDFVCTIEYDYPAFHLTMHCYICSIKVGTPHLLEHKAAKWLDSDSLNNIDWLPADRNVVAQLLR